MSARSPAAERRYWRRKSIVERVSAVETFREATIYGPTPPRLERVYRLGTMSERASTARRPVSAAQRRLLDARLADHVANPDDVITWGELKSELRR